MGHDLNARQLPHLWRKRTTRREQLSNVARIAWARLWALPAPARGALLLMLLVLAGSLAGCQSLSMPPSEPPRNPAPPQISTELPQESYSSRVEKTFKTWQQRLTGTPPT